MGLLGTKGVGKDTVADYIVSRYNVEKRAFASPIKEACAILFQLPIGRFEGEDKEVCDAHHELSPRQMMQLVGTDFFRDQVCQDFWIDHFKKWYAARDPSRPVVVTDVRFQNEVDVIKALGGEVVRLIRPHKGSGRHTMSDLHVTETGVAELQGVDATIENDGSLEELYGKVNETMAVREKWSWIYFEELYDKSTTSIGAVIELKKFGQR